MQIHLLSSLEKVFPDHITSEKELTALSVLKNERVSFQLACLSDSDGTLALTVDSTLRDRITVRRVGYVPSALPAYPDRNDDDYLTLSPGLFPDPLFPSDGTEEVHAGEWFSFWLTLRLDRPVTAGEYPIALTVSDGMVTERRTLSLTVVDAMLPPQSLTVTQWFHTDCIAELHGLEVFSEPFWDMVRKYMETASDNGINMILTPLFTPALDTAVGGERLTVQLVDVTKTESGWEFGFDKVDRWIDMARECGFLYFELSHLFTQWGAQAAPKIMANVNGESVRVFGWDTPADGAEYIGFLSAYLPAITAYFKDRGIADRVWFHLSDEPHGDEHRAQYVKLREIIAPWIEGFQTMDALSQYPFYESGAVGLPVPKLEALDTFVSHDVRPRWTYYCCSQCKGGVPNRFMAMPGYRTRVMGVLAYLYDLDGFLQWGYNFYHTQYSVSVIDPFRVTDAGGAFPSGDSFSVYPGEDGPLESLRIGVFYEGLEDLRALRHLESLVGRERVVSLVREISGMETMTVFTYPRSADFLLTLRRRVNAEIAARSGV